MAKKAKLKNKKTTSKEKKRGAKKAPDRKGPPKPKKPAKPETTPGPDPRTTFDFWKRHVASSSYTIAPEADNEITGQTVFLWISESYQVGACLGGGGFWTWFPDAWSMAGYLRHCYFPHCFGDWLVRREWDANGDAFLSAEDLFSTAEAAEGCRYQEDIPKMREVTGLLDSAMTQKGAAGCLASIRKAVARFAKSGISDGSMSFSVDVVGNLKDMRDSVLARFSAEDSDEEVEEQIGMTRDAWTKLTRPADINRERSRQIVEILDELAEY